MTSGEHQSSEPEYLKVARFSGEKPAGRAYRQAEELLFRSPDTELSAYRFHLNRIWHVAVLGDQPTEELDRKLRRILSRGEPTSLPEEILQQLQRRRAQAIRLGPWVERHVRPDPPSEL
jgi:hypothetical protein